MSSDSDNDRNGNTDTDINSDDDNNNNDNFNITELLDEYGTSVGKISANNGRAIMRNIIIDHRKTLQLLSQVFPEKVVAKLRNGETVKPQAFNNVTIFFSDIGIIIIIILYIIKSASLSLS